jgi:hypothetical protein
MIKQIDITVIVISFLAAPVGVSAQGHSMRRDFSDSGVVQLSLPTVSDGALRQATATKGTRLALRLQAASQPPQQRSWAGRHPVILGFLIGAGIGAVAGAIGCAGHGGDGEPGPQLCATAAAVGYGGIGAGVGYIAGRVTR